jgi:hypothetical protein
MSVVFPPVHEPMYERSSFTSFSREAAALRSGQWGQAIVGSIDEASNSYTSL